MVMSPIRSCFICCPPIFRSPDAAQRVALREAVRCRAGAVADAGVWYGPGSAERHEECRTASGTQTPWTYRSAHGASLTVSLPSSVDVAIIGAGAAGLGAAHALQNSGLSIIVLEARDRVGGPAHTFLAAPGIAFDLRC